MEKKRETLENKINLLRKATQEKDKQIKSLETKVNILENAAIVDTTPKPTETFKCELCTFVSNTKGGLQTHSRKKNIKIKKLLQKNPSLRSAICVTMY